MSSLSIRLRPYRPAAFLALLAVVAQLWIGQIGSAEHLARLFAAGTLSSDICSAQDSSREGGNSGTGHGGHLGKGLSCAMLCSASPSESPPLLAPHPATGFAQAAQVVPRRNEPQFDGRRRVALRPPAQAPPVA